MSQPAPSSYSGNIEIALEQQGDSHYICQATSMLEALPSPSMKFHGQSPKHAIAMALEEMARTLRIAAETEQNVDWEAVERSPSGEINEKRFHIVLHYERVAYDESKFDAMVNTQLGNTVVENAEITIIRIDPDLPI